jgi:hypothetical protein
MDYNKEKALKVLTNVIEKAFAAGHSVAFGDAQYVQRRRGEEIETENQVFEALESGIFKLCKVSYGGGRTGAVEDSEVYVKAFDHGDVDLLVGFHQGAMSVRDIDEMMVGLTAKTVLTQMVREKRGSVGREVEQAELDPREKALKVLTHVVTSAFKAGHSVAFGDNEYVQKRRGQEIETDTEILETTDSGIFKKCVRERGGVKSDTYLKFFDHGDIDGLVARETAKLPIKEIDEIMIGVSAKTVLTALAREKRRPAVESDNDVGGFTR